MGKAMKAMAAMKAMKAMKKKAVSKIAKSKNAKAVVFHGTKEKTLSGLTKADLIKNKKKLGRQEGFCPHQGLDYCCAEGQEGFGREGLRCNQEGFSSLQESQGALPVSVHEHAKASAQGVGMSTPFERRCFGWRLL